MKKKIYLAEKIEWLVGDFDEEDDEWCMVNAGQLRDLCINRRNWTEDSISRILKD